MPAKRHRPGTTASSVLRHVEEIVLATSGEDAFEMVFAVGAARLLAPSSKKAGTAELRRAIAAAARRHPVLEIVVPREASDDLLGRVDELFQQALVGEDLATLDALFESLVPRVAKADKGQFFTPRTVVDFVVEVLAPSAGEVFLDPACGSGAFLSRGRAAGAEIHGADVDPRAVRIARLTALALKSDPAAILRSDGLRTTKLPSADVVATNPPFAGRADAEGFAVGRLVRTPERDVLFLERAVRLLRPGGRLGIVLPYNKASGSAFAGARRWLLEHARILAIVGLPRETFLPHTSQRTFVLFAEKRAAPLDPRSPEVLAEPVTFFVSRRAGKDSGGEPIRRSDGTLDHDLDALAPEVARVFAGKRAPGGVARAIAELGDALILAPERWTALSEPDDDGVPLGDLVIERRERGDAGSSVVVDTTHARDGLLDLASAVRAGGNAKSAKKLAREGDLVISRLRPYLRQIALVHPRAIAAAGARSLALSTEFYVLCPRDPGDDLAFLLPFLLGSRAQAILSAAQEGGHHPRVPRSTLLALRVPKALVRDRRKLSKATNARLDDLYRALASYQSLLA